MKPNGEEFEQTPEFVLKVAFLGRGELFRSAQAVREAARLALDTLSKHGYKISKDNSENPWDGDSAEVV